MNLARLLQSVAPMVVDHYVATVVADARRQIHGMTDDELAKVENDARELALGIATGLIDTVTAQERKADTQGKAHFVSHIAAELLHGWHGEPTHDAAREAVAIAKTLVDEAEKVCRTPARSASPPEA